MRPLAGQLRTILFGLWLLFVISSSFSIALSQSALGLSVLLFIAIGILEKHNPIPSALRSVYLVMGLYVLWLAISSLAGPTPLGSLSVIKEEWLFAVLPVGIYAFKWLPRRNMIVTALAIGVGLMAIYGIVQHFTGINFTKSMPPVKAPSFGYLVSGSFSHRLTFAGYFYCASVFLLTFAIINWRIDRRSLLYLVAALLGMIAAILTQARGPLAAMIVTLIIGSVFIGKRMIPFLLPLSVVALIAILVLAPSIQPNITEKLQRDLSRQYPGSRVYIWNKSLSIIADNPLIGVGKGNFKKAYSDLLPDGIDENRRQSHAHNDLFNIAASAGLPAAVFYIAIWLSILLALYRRWKLENKVGEKAAYLAASMMASLCFFLCSLTEATFADEEVRQFLMFAWAAGLWVLVDQNGTKQPQESKIT